MTTVPPPRPSAAEQPRVPFGEALRFWVRLGFINFGGPAGQIATMHRELVDRKQWISEPAYLRALNFCTLLPGPEAQQLATYIGWRLHGIRGGLVAGGFFVIPSIFVLLVLSWLAVAHTDVPAIAGLFYGIQAVVIAIGWRRSGASASVPSPIPPCGCLPLPPSWPCSCSASPSRWWWRRRVWLDSCCSAGVRRSSSGQGVPTTARRVRRMNPRPPSIHPCAGRCASSRCSSCSGPCRWAPWCYGGGGTTWWWRRRCSSRGRRSSPSVGRMRCSATSPTRR